MKHLALTIALVLLIPFLAQASLTGQEAALGGIHSNQTGGITGIRYNPANLASPSGDRFVLSLGPKLSLNSWGWDLLPMLNQHWDDDDKENLIARVGGDAVVLTADAVAHVGLQIQTPFAALGASGGAEGLGQAELPKQYIELALVGNDIDALFDGDPIAFNLEEVHGSGAAYAQAVGSVARDFEPDFNVPIDRIELGANVKGLYGLYLAEFQGGGTVDVTYANNQTTITAEDIDTRIRQAQSGTGYAVDLGGKIYSGDLIIDASVTNVIGSLTWYDVEEERFFRDGQEELLRFGFDLDEFDFAFESPDFDDFLQEESTVIASYEWTLPRITRVGLSYQATSKLLLLSEVRYTEYFQPEPTTSLLLAAGAEFKLVPQLPLRVGVRSTDGELAVDTGLGLHLGPLRIDAGVQNILSLLGDGKGFGLGINVTTAF